MRLRNEQKGVPGITWWDPVELVEALVLRLAVGLRAEMPLAEDRRGIAGGAQHFGHGDFLRRQRDIRPLDRNQRKSGADGIAPGHQGGARRRAGWLDQKLGQPQAFRRQAVDARSWRPSQLSAAVHAKVAIADVVGEDEQDVRLRLLRRCRGRDEGKRRQQAEPGISSPPHLRTPPNRTLTDDAGRSRSSSSRDRPRATHEMPRASDESTHYGCLAGPICGARTGFAIPKKTTTPWPPQRVDSASGGTPKQLSISCQLFMTQTSPAGPTARSVCICRPPST